MPLFTSEHLKVTLVDPSEVHQLVQALALERHYKVTSRLYIAHKSIVEREARGSTKPYETLLTLLQQHPCNDYESDHTTSTASNSRVLNVWFSLVSQLKTQRIVNSLFTLQCYTDGAQL